MAIKEIRPMKSSERMVYCLILPKMLAHCWRGCHNLFLKVLNEGMDFDSLNITNIMLIPKVTHPLNLKNFMPINLCNVLYKVIEKMIVNHFKSDPL